jgi:hypothetical protein
MWIVWTAAVGFACSVLLPPPRAEAWQVVPPAGATEVALGSVVRVLPVGDWAAGVVELGGRVRLVDAAGAEVDVDRTAWNGRIDLATRALLRPDASYAVEELVAFAGDERLPSARYREATREAWVRLASFRTGTEVLDPTPPEVTVAAARAVDDPCVGAHASARFAVAPGASGDGVLVELEDRRRGVVASVRLDEAEEASEGGRWIRASDVVGSELRVVLRTPTGERASPWVGTGLSVREADPWGPQGAPTQPPPRELPSCATLQPRASGADERGLVAVGAVGGEPWYIAADRQTRVPSLVHPSRGTELRLHTTLPSDVWSWEAAYDGDRVTLARFAPGEPGRLELELVLVIVGSDGVVREERTVATSTGRPVVLRMSQAGERLLILWDNATNQAFATVVRSDGEDTIELGPTLQSPVLATGPDAWVVGGVDPLDRTADLWLATIPFDRDQVEVVRFTEDPEADLVSLGATRTGGELVLGRRGEIEVARWAGGALSDRAVVGHHRWDRTEQIVRAGPRWIVSWTAGEGPLPMMLAVAMADDGTRTLPARLGEGPMRTVGLPDGLFGISRTGWGIWGCVPSSP